MSRVAIISIGAANKVEDIRGVACGPRDKDGYVPVCRDSDKKIDRYLAAFVYPEHFAADVIKTYTDYVTAKKKLEEDFLRQQMAFPHL